MFIMKRQHTLSAFSCLRIITTGTIYDVDSHSNLSNLSNWILKSKTERQRHRMSRVLHHFHLYSRKITIVENKEFDSNLEAILVHCIYHHLKPGRICLYTSWSTLQALSFWIQCSLPKWFKILVPASSYLYEILLNLGLPPITLHQEGMGHKNRAPPVTNLFVISLHLFGLLIQNLQQKY